MDLIEASRAHAHGEIDFKEFARYTGRVWSWWATRLTRRDVPAWFDDDDVRQELLLEAWRAAERWHEEKGARPATWIAQNAIRAARKSVMRARGVNRHHWRWDDPSRHDVAAEDIEMSAAVDAEQEDALLGRGVLLSIAEEHGPLAAIVAQAIARGDGDIDTAAEILYADAQTRLLCRLGSVGQSRKLVEQWIRVLARKGR